MEDPKIAMDPLEAGQMVLRGMHNNDLYIFTHPEYKQIIQARNEALQASIPMNPRATNERVAMVRAGTRNSIYSIERDRKRCTQPKGVRVTK